MNASDKRAALDRRAEEFGWLLRERRIVVDPGPYFVDRVIARLPRAEEAMLAWAARRVLPVTLALAAVLTVAVLVTHQPQSSRAGAALRSETSQQGTDPLDWLLENGRAIR
jgi:hypothetical protein